MADANGVKGEKAPCTETSSQDKSEPGDNGDQGTSSSSNPPPPPSLMDLVEVDGEFFPTFPVTISTADHVRNLRNMPMKEDDIIIAAFPKCGTHWIWEVAQMLISGKAEHDIRGKEQVMMEFVEVEKFEPIPSPRVLNSHLFLRHLSKEIVTKKPRIIHVIRNPKDVAVSTFFHIIQMLGFDMVEKMGPAEFAKVFLNGGLKPGSFFDYFSYMKEMVQFQREHPDVPFVTLYYEDVKENPVKAVRQLADFLKVEASDQLCTDIADLCSFKKLKHADENFKEKGRIVDGAMFKPGKGQLFRKGEVGDWKNYFTVALSEEYDRVVPQKLEGLGIKTRYTI